MNWIKIIFVISLASSFFLKDIVSFISFQDISVCYSDMNEEDSSEKNEKDLEDEKDEFKLASHCQSTLTNCIAKKHFHFFSEKAYFEYYLEIHSPPPEFV